MTTKPRANFRQNAILTDISARRNATEIKRAALLFDKIIVIKTQEGQYLDSKNLDKNYFGIDKDELDWLEERNIVSFESDPSEEFIKRSDKDSTPIQVYRRALIGNVSLVRPDQGQEVILAQASDFVSRYSSTWLQAQTPSVRQIPILYGAGPQLGALYNPLEAIEASSYNQASVIVLAQLPVPDEMTPWENIIDFKSNGNAPLAFFSLRKWLKHLTEKPISEINIRDKIDEDLELFQHEYKESKIKTSIEWVRLTVTSSVGFIEDLLRFNARGATEKGFQIVKETVRISNQEAEMAKHGPYYILKARNTFGKR